MLQALFILSLANFALSITVTRSVMFEKFRRRFRPDSYLGRLFNCPYCFGHWTASPLVYLSGVSGVDTYNWRDWTASGFHSQAVYHYDIIFFQHLYVFDPITVFIQSFAVIGMSALLSYTWIWISRQALN